jgi:hypothetical protein
VFDSVGRLAGIALSNDEGPDRWLPVAAITAKTGAEWSFAAAAQAPTAATELVHEAALNHVVQVLISESDQGGARH